MTHARSDRLLTATLLIAKLFCGERAALALDSTNNFSGRFVIDMVHNNPGESLQATVFRDPHKLAVWGYNGQGIMAEADSCETFDAIEPDILPKGGGAREWIEQHAKSLEQLAEQAHRSGLKAYAWFQFIVLPKALMARDKNEICDAQGRIDLERPMTQRILRAQISELFDRCPALDGLIVRTGEIYLFDSPYHTSSGGGERKQDAKRHGHHSRTAKPHCAIENSPRRSVRETRQDGFLPHLGFRK